MLLDSLPPLMIRNDSGQVIPPFGCVQISGDVVVSGSDLIFPVVRPTAALVNQGNAGRFLFCGDNEIASGKLGAAYSVHPMAMAAVADAAGVDPTVNWRQFCGPVADSFILGNGYFFEVVAKAATAGVNTTSDSKVCVIQPRAQGSMCKNAERTDLKTDELQTE